MVKSIGCEKEGGIVHRPQAGWNGWCQEWEWAFIGWGRGVECVKGWGWGRQACVCFGHAWDVCWIFSIACLACCGPWCCRVGHNWATELNWQVKRTIWRSREVGSHPFTSGDGLLGHGYDSTLLADDQKSGMKTGKRWCKRNPGRKEFREVKEGYQGWYLRSAEINPSCGQLGLAFRSSVQQVQGSIEVQHVVIHSACRCLSGQEPVVLTYVTPAKHTHTHTHLSGVFTVYTHTHTP